ncbi:MAG TPA: flagellar biosynthesis protein FlhB [Solirubrobacteraceae bacterium]|nr:flagellar biosynthesis protein FlhB [Solirubrobacteraceae bacterium]
MAGSDKTEKATPKKREEARKKGQVAKSADLNGAVVLLAALLALSAFGPGILERVGDATRSILHLVATPSVVEREGIGTVLGEAGAAALRAVAPIAFVCLVAGVMASVVQVGLKPAAQAIKPDPKKLNPLSGAKQIFGKHALFELVKNVAKVAVVGAIAALALLPKLEELAALVGMPPAVVLPQLASTVLSIAQRAAFGYLVIAFADYGYQRWRHENSLKMDKQEVKDEYKQQELPAEVKGAQRRRAMEMARARMMDAVPTADVVVTNPTHFSVALRYSSDALAPVVVAKGQDHVALRIRELAREHGVMVVPNPPLARTLHASVDVGKMIPEELFQAVAELLAYVYRVNSKAIAA